MAIECGERDIHTHNIEQSLSYLVYNLCAHSYIYLVDVQ